MNFKNQESSPEIRDTNISQLPAVEALLDKDKAREIWPELLDNKEFSEQIEERNELIKNLNGVFENLPRPDIKIEEAVDNGIVAQERAKKAFNSLSDLLESDKGYGRIVLYLPFEMMPNKNWRPKGAELKDSSDRFIQSYVNTWRDLLHSHDVAANFVDGDVLEVEQRSEDLPRVVKAAHLIPILLEKGYIDRKEVKKIYDDTDDEVLRSSIEDALAVLDDEPEEKKETKEDLSLSSLEEKIQKEFEKIESKNYGEVTEKRREWLKEKAKQEIIQRLGENIGLAIINQNFNKEQALSFLSKEASPSSQQALIQGIRFAIESTINNPEEAEETYAMYKDILLATLESDDSKTREALFQTLRRLNKLGVVDQNQLSSLGIVLPKLEGPFSKNIELMDQEVAEIQNAINNISQHPELSQYVFPTALVFGSRLKGYGEQEADIDLAVFIKPGTPFEKRAELKAMLKEVFNNRKFGKEIVEFWLEEKDGALDVIDFETKDVDLGESYWTHVLFNSSWIGEQKTIQELQQKTLSPYFLKTEKQILGEDARRVYLEELERDSLQYRLMHKGYERFNPPYGGINKKNRNRIGGNSMFFDSGYRQLATKLFASRVFLPQVER